MTNEQLQFQSTHPHGVRHFIYYKNPRAWKFQSTHPHGVRLQSAEYQKALLEFQSTHPHGVRLARPVTLYTLQWGDVSIHAPTRGATFWYRRGRRGYGCFNPRTHTGCDGLAGIGSIVASQFQSTHPHGVRLIFRSSLSFFIAFQSTHPHGVRPNKPLLS